MVISKAPSNLKDRNSKAYVTMHLFGFFIWMHYNTMRCTKSLKDQKKIPLEEDIRKDPQGLPPWEVN